MFIFTSLKKNKNERKWESLKLLFVNVTFAKNWTLYDIVQTKTIWYSISTPNQTHFWGIVSLIWRILKHGPKSSLLIQFVVFICSFCLLIHFFIAPFECCSSGSQSRPINCQAAEKSKSHSGKYLWFASYEKKIQNQIEIYKYRFKIFRKKFVKLLSGASFEAKVKNCFTRISTLDTLLKDAFTYKHIKFIYQYKMYVNILLCRYVQIYR